MIKLKKISFIIFLGFIVFNINLSSLFAQQANQKQEIPLGAQKKISIELKNIDVIEVLKLLAQKGNINIVAGKNVTGKVTLFLEDVEIWDALRIIFESNNLAYLWDGRILKVLTESDYEKVYGRKFHDKRKIKIFKLKYSKASSLANSLNQLKSPLGKIVIDDRTNTLIVLDVPSKLEIIEQTISAMDAKVQTKVFSLNYATPGIILEAAKNILSQNGHIQGDSLSNKIIVSDVEENVLKITKLVREYDIPSFTITRVFPLKYANFEEIEKKLKEELTETVGIIRADERTNTIIITDLPEKIRRMEKIIHAYDKKTRVVLIEAKVVQVTLNDAFALGINWELVLETFRGRNLNFSLVNATSDILGSPAAPGKSFISDGVQFPSDTTTTTTSTTSATGSTTTDTGTTATASTSTDSFFPQPGNVPFDLTKITPPFTYPRVNQGGTVVATGTLYGTDAFSAAINALKTVGKVNLLSSPRITTISGEEAKIAVATREAFVTNTVVQNNTVATTAENVTFIDVGVILTVTPKINPDNYIQMKISPEVSAVVRTLTTSSGNVIPIVSTQEADTTVLVRDGVTVVLAGLITDSRKRLDSRVPILGSLPIVGSLFRHTSYQVVKDEIVIFLTPHIISGDTTYEGTWAASQGIQKYVEDELKNRATEEIVIKRDEDKIDPDLQEKLKDEVTAEQLPSSIVPNYTTLSLPPLLSLESSESDADYYNLED